MYGKGGKNSNWAKVFRTVGLTEIAETLSMTTIVEILR